MTRLEYVGKFGPKQMSVPGCGKVERGGTLDVLDEVAAGLLRTQPSEWKKASSEKFAGGTVSSGKAADDKASGKGE